MNDSTDPLPPDPAPRKMNLLAFFLVLLAPAVLTLLTAAAGTANGDAAAYIAIYGSGVSGLCCGIMLARRIGGGKAAQVLLALMLGAGLGFASFVLSFAGCALGGALK